MTITTPPAPQSPQAPPQGPRGSARVIAILAITLGVVLIAGTVVLGVLSSARGGGASGSGELTADATGIRSLDVDVAAADLTVVFSGDEVQLDVTGNVDDWRLTRDEDSLRVSTSRSWWGSWGLFDQADRAVLTLPASLESTALDAEFSLSAGHLRADGRFDDLGIDLSAGDIDVSGSARNLDADVSAGRLVLDLDSVDEADIHLSAGNIAGALTGTAPTETGIDVSAGRLDLTIPDETYAVRSDVSAGTFDNGLRVDAGSRNTITVSVSAGFAGLRAAR